MTYSPPYSVGLLILAVAGVVVAASSERVADNNEQQDILARFSTKVLLNFDTGKSEGAEHEAAPTNRLDRLEIEEIYDQVRGLAKITIINEARAERAELFFRAEDELQLEMVHSLAADDDSAPPRTCTASLLSKEPPVNSYYFGLLQRITQQESGRRGSGVLLGPSVFLHSEQAQLLQRFRERSAQIEQNTTGSRSSSSSSGQPQRRRFIVEQDVGLVRELTDSGGGATIEFSQADFVIHRSPLLAQLAAFARYSNAKTGLSYSIDWLEIDNATLAHMADSEQQRDLFRLPQVRACLPAEPLASAVGFDSAWSRFFQVRSTRFSMNLHAPGLSPAGVHVAADMERQLMRLDLAQQSRNVIDLKHEFIYHMPNEPLAVSQLGSAAGPDQLDQDQHAQASAQTTTDDHRRTNKVRNSQCTLISTSRSFPGLSAFSGLEAALVSSGSSANKWAHLIGRPASIIYLGSGRLEAAAGQWAHEFELSYANADNLPPFFVLLFGRDQWNDPHNLQTKTPPSLLVGKLWLRASDSSCSPSDRSHRPLGCVDPTPLRVRIELIQGETHKVLTSKEAHFADFEWELFGEDEVAKLDRSYESFDRRVCPVQKLDVQLEVEWKEEIEEENFKSGQEFCQHRGQLDDLVFGQLNTYLLDHASFDVELMELRLRQATLGTMVAHYALTLSELPDLANSFTRLASRVPQKAIAKHSALLASAPSFRLLFECLGWASQFGNSHGVLHSPVEGCYVYDRIDIDQVVALSRLADGQSVELFTAYARDLESFSKSIRNNLSGLRRFETEHLDAINHEIVRNNRDDNGFEACVSRPTGQSLVRDIKFSKLRLDRSHSSSATNRGGQLVPVKSGFKFVEFPPSSGDGEGGHLDLVKSRQQFEVVSLSDCQRRCNELPECASFSHCKNVESQHEYCQLSELRLGSKLLAGANSSKADTTGADFARQPGCQLHGKDYLQIFEAARNAAELAGGVSVELKNWARLGPAKGAGGDDSPQDAMSELDCASLCLTSGANQCMRFLHCQPHGCYSYRRPQPESLAQPEVAATPSLRVVNPSQCSLFKRKSISLYRRVMSIDRGPFNWRLDSANSTTVSPAALRAEVLPGAVSEERCAQLCTDNVECQSFDSCSTAIYSPAANAKQAARQETSSAAAALDVKRKLPHFVCTLLSHSLTSGLTLVEIETNNPTDSGENRVELSRHCSHFERQGLEPASKFIIGQMAARDGDIESRHRALGEPSADSKALGLFSAALLGMALGIGANMLAGFLMLSKPLLPAALSSSSSFFSRRQHNR